jgi:hypothetical protein
MYKYLLVLLIAIQLCGCTSIKAMFAMTRSTDDFITLADNPAIRYEAGSEAFAEIISPYVTTAIHTIETRQGDFPDAVTIYVPATIDHFADYCTSTLPSACVVRGRLFMSPKLLGMQERIPGILVHELSHLQLSQSVGFWNFQTGIPAWFKEGLAVYVADGAGAEHVSKPDAIDAIRQGNAITPNGSGSLMFRKTASSFGLETHMFYRQSSLYVEWLHDSNPTHFQQTMALLRSGNSLDESVNESYGFSVEHGWNLFISSL